MDKVLYKVLYKLKAKRRCHLDEKEMIMDTRWIK